MTLRADSSSSDLCVIVVNYNTSHLFDEFFATLFVASSHLSTQILLVDNASTDISKTVLRSKYSAIPVTFNEVNVGFGRANNQVVPLIEGRYALLLNTDAFVAPDTLTKTVSWMDAHPDYGVLGVKLTDRAGNLQPSCRYFPTPLNSFLTRTGLQRFFPWVQLVDNMAWDHSDVRDCDWVPGCYYLIRREVLDEVGLFDPRYFMYFEEVDHCRRVKAEGWKVVYYSDTSVVHIGGESAKTIAAVTATGRQIPMLQIESELLYFRKHHGALGLVWHIFLTVVGDTLLASKSLMKKRGRAEVVSSWQHTLALFHLLRLTHCATRPTR